MSLFTPADYRSRSIFPSSSMATTNEQVKIQSFVSRGQQDSNTSGISTTQPETNNGGVEDERADVILAMQEPYMQQIISGEKTYEFRKYRLNKSVKRIWFYRTAPYSSLDYVCEILPARTRDPGDEPLEEDGLGNNEFNTRHKDWENYDFAYKILSVYELKSIPLSDLETVYGLKGVPRRVVYVPDMLLKAIDWRSQTKLQ
jgi:hypothetical protein